MSAIFAAMKSSNRHAGSKNEAWNRSGYGDEG
jgi:hypothetical protein